MSSSIVRPVAKSLYLCEGHLGYSGGKTDLINIFNAINPPSYPYVQKHFVVYARLSQGLGQIPFFVDIRFAQTGQLVHVSNTFTLSFPSRDITVEMSLTMQGIPFASAGVYLVQLFLDNQWECDTTLLLL